MPTGSPLLAILLASLAIVGVVTLNRKVNKMATKQQQLEDFIARLNVVTNEIAADLKALRDELGDSVSQDTLTTLSDNIAALETMGSDPNTPLPAPTPEA